MIVEFEEIAFLVELVGVGVEKGKDGLQLRDGVSGDVHERRLVGADGQRSGGAALALVRRTVGTRAGVYWSIVRIRRRRRREVLTDLMVRERFVRGRGDGRSGGRRRRSGRRRALGTRELGDE